MSGKLIPYAAAIVLATTGAASAGPIFGNPLYFQGFETDTGGWTVSTGGDNNGAITREPSGGGSLAVPAFQGSNYGSVTNDTNGYQAGYGSGGFSALGGNGVTPTGYPGAGFSQSISVYINPSTPAPANASVPAFWIDMTPDSVAPDGVGCGAFACSDEQSFNLYYNGTSVGVHATGSSSAFANISTSGWYTFQITYQKGALPTDLVTNQLNVYDSSGNLLGSAAEQGNSDGATLLSSNLAGPGYIWLPVWQNGFSGNDLAIDNVRADTLTPVPEPSALALLSTALLAMLGTCVFSRRRR